VSQRAGDNGAGAPWLRSTLHAPLAPPRIRRRPRQSRWPSTPRSVLRDRLLGYSAPQPFFATKTGSWVVSRTRLMLRSNLGHASLGSIYGPARIRGTQRIEGRRARHALHVATRMVPGARPGQLRGSAGWHRTLAPSARHPQALRVRARRRGADGKAPTLGAAPTPTPAPNDCRGLVRDQAFHVLHVLGTTGPAAVAWTLRALARRRRPCSVLVACHRGARPR
jgi:hypothetical protein